ncbi:MAG: rane-bound lytic murein transglycosylase [Sphingomonadales bacterium]|jgi:lytic murein transglycosylase|nr:rane-bound lytic murein transglycosylase [Sphingomonadales bacterium]MEA3043328.1 rane-bound lytic murein transglycosylase [Sphingomonadales bacterium]MEA3045885.1 rane-bound lytic murein transglycosylase [Sphingomonadales bacterium]
MRFVHGLAAAVLIAGAPAARLGDGAAQAQSGGLSQAGFEDYLPRLRIEAERAGIRPATLDRIFPTLTFSARTVELDRAQPGGRAGVPTNPPFAPYRARQLTQALIDRGRARYAENRLRLNEIARRYGVPSQYLIAIWGKETGYGTIMGNFDLLNSLASLAYEGRRRELFTTEFIATLRLVERGFPRDELQGSWAGAAGHPQFLPSVYLRLAVDGDGDGRPDIWRSHLDGLASIANYLRNAGWRPGLTWGTAVRVPVGFDRSTVANRLRAPRCAAVFARHSRWLTAAEWRSRGIANSLPDQALASLIEPDGPDGTAYLTTNNYRVILDYNCSNFYALTVALLADSVARQN